MSGGVSKSRSKSVVKTQSMTEQKDETQDEKHDETQDELKKSAVSVDPTAPSPIIRRYKMPYRNFLRDVKIQMQHEHLSNKQIAKIASQRWKNMTHAEKEPYIQEAAYAKELDAQKTHKQTSARKQAPKRKKKCPKCGGYPASSSPSEQSVSETPTEAGTAEEESGEGEEHKEGYSTDTSCYSYASQTEVAAENGAPEHDAPKNSNRRQTKKKRTKHTRKNVKRRKQETPSSGSASYCSNSLDNNSNSVSITSDLAVRSNASNESASI